MRDGTPEVSTYVEVCHMSTTRMNIDLKALCVGEQG